MNNPWRKLARRYRTTLRQYLRDQCEAGLEQAFTLGRMAVAQGLGVLDLARAHQAAVAVALAAAPAAKQRSWILRAAEAFFLQALSPFEITHRGFHKTNVELQQVIATLEKRNLELDELNRDLRREIVRHQRAKRALRESREHYRTLFNQARQMEEDLRHLSNRVLHAEEQERLRISRELHDEVGQALTAISVHLAVVNHHSAGPGRCLDHKIAHAQRLLQQTMESVHRFARELRPAMLDELGLLPALRSHLKSFAERTGLRVRFRATGFPGRLDSERKMAVFRITQESLTNVARHARASLVHVSLRQFKDTLCLEIKDDGRSSWDGRANATKARRPLGLLGMQERARLVNGQFTIRPDPGKGTTVRVVIPFRRGATRAAAQPGVNRAASRRSRLPLPSLQLNPQPVASSWRNYGSDQYCLGG